MKNLLITDHDCLLTKILKQQFEAIGFQVSVAHDGTNALKILRETNPEVVILDIGLPDMSGVELLKEIRSNPRLKNIPIFVVSNSYNFSGSVKAALDAGATHFISKEDCELKHLISQVNQLIEAKNHQVSSDPLPSEKRPLVHIADHDAVSAGVMEFFVNQAGFDIQSARNGLQSINRISENAPSLIILDEHMPLMDGVHLVEMIKGDPKISSIPVIMITSEKDDAGRKLKADRQVVEYMRKPLNLNNLVNTVKKHLNMAHTSGTVPDFSKKSL